MLILDGHIGTVRIMGWGHLVSDRQMLLSTVRFVRRCENNVCKCKRLFAELIANLMINECEHADSAVLHSRNGVY